jgi:hypothetical protein
MNVNAAMDIEAFFTPITRYEAFYKYRMKNRTCNARSRSEGLPVTAPTGTSTGTGTPPALPDDWREVEFNENAGVSLEDLFATLTWDELLSFARNYHAVWMTPSVLIAVNVRWFPSSHNGHTLSAYPLVLTLEKKDDDCYKHNLPEQCIHVMASNSNTSRSQAMRTSDLLFRLLARSQASSVRITSRCLLLPVSASALRYFLEVGDTLENILLDSVALTTFHCQVLATTRYSLKLQIKLAFCPILTSTSTAFIAWLRGPRGPVRMAHCQMDAAVLAGAIQGSNNNINININNTRLEDLVHSQPYHNTGFALIARALAGNRSLQTLTLDQEMSDKNWNVLCESVQSHPVLQKLSCRGNGQRILRGKTADMSEERKTRRMRALADAVQDNTVLQHVQLACRVMDHEIYQTFIYPRLQTNLYRPRVQAVQEQADDSIRPQVLLQAVLAVRDDPHLVWMFLSENRDVVAGRGPAASTLLVRPGLLAYF